VNRRPLAILAVTALVVAACGEPADVPVVATRPATIAELRGPWQATPVVLDPATRGRIEEACRREMEMPPGRAAVLIDARGAAVVTVRMDGGSCNALELAEDGQILGAGGGFRATEPEGLQRLQGSRFAELEKETVNGGGLLVEGWAVRGRFGADIVSVVIAPANRPVVIATLENGWFGAWWPDGPGDPPRDGNRHPPFFVRGYDAAGVLLDEVGP
jgi:hypothetical protein